MQVFLLKFPFMHTFTPKLPFPCHHHFVCISINSMSSLLLWFQDKIWYLALCVFFINFSIFLSCPTKDSVELL